MNIEIIKKLYLNEIKKNDKESVGKYIWWKIYLKRYKVNDKS